jgi:mRNA interferase MazF
VILKKIEMAKGDVVLLSFPFTDLSGSKLRPAVVLVESALDVTVCFVTTQLFWEDENDLRLQPNKNSGIKKESILRVSKIATMDKAFLKGKIGILNPDEITGLNRKLKMVFELD